MPGVRFSVCVFFSAGFLFFFSRCSIQYPQHTSKRVWRSRLGSGAPKFQLNSTKTWSIWVLCARLKRLQLITPKYNIITYVPGSILWLKADWTTLLSLCCASSGWHSNATATIMKCITGDWGCTAIIAAAVVNVWFIITWWYTARCSAVNRKWKWLGRFFVILKNNISRFRSVKNQMNRHRTEHYFSKGSVCICWYHVMIWSHGVARPSFRNCGCCARR